MLVASINAPAKGPGRFFGKSKRQDYLVAHVKGSGGKGSFLEKFETIEDSIPKLYDNEQPPFFQPREEWGHWGKKPFPYPCTADSDRMIKSKLGDESLVRKYFDNPAINISWRDHIGDLWTLHQDLEEEDKMLLNVSLGSVLRMLGNGLEMVATMTRLEFIIPRKGCKRNSLWKNPSLFLPDDYERTEAYHNLGFGSPEKWREGCIGRRFFVGFFLHQYNRHFTTFIWDRKKAVFMHFDTLPDDQSIRAKDVSLVWREYLATAGQPYNFDFHAIPVSPQQGKWECGLLSTFSLFQTLRGLVGVTAGDLARISLPKVLEIDGARNRPDKPFDLLVRDWVLDPWANKGKNYSSSVEMIKGIYQTMIKDELGIKDGYHQRKDSRGKLEKLQSTWTDDIEYTPAEEDKTVRADWLFTDMGGYMPATPKNLGVTSNWRDDRLIPAPPYQPNDTGLIPQGPGSWALLSAVRTLQDMPSDLIKWYKGQGLEVKNNVPVKPFVPGEEISISDSDESSSESKGQGRKEAFTTPAPPDKTKKPWTPSKPFQQLRLSTTPKRPRPSSNSGSEYAPPSEDSSSSKGKGSQKGSKAGSQSKGQDGGPDTGDSFDQVMHDRIWGLTSDKRAYAMDCAPHIQGAENFTCATYESDNEDASSRRPTGKATWIMSTIVGEKGWLGEVGARPTQRLLTGNYATHVPAGLVKLSQWDEIISAAARPWVPAAIAKESRDERMKKRQKSKGD